MTDPEAALRKLRELRDEVDDFEGVRVIEALRGGASFAAIARALGISRQSAHRRYRHLAPMAIETVRTSSHARRVVHLACKEADASGASGLGSAHLLLGVLRSGGGASSALQAVGVTAEAMRRCLADTPTDRAASEQDGVGRAVLAEAAEIARARRTEYVEPEHIALAAINGPDGGALRAITAIGIPPATVRERLGCGS